jgi:hypothetical protein
MVVYRNDHIYAVVLSNVQTGLLNRIPKDLETILFGVGELSKRPEVRPILLEASALAQYAGTYRTSSIPAPVNIFVKAGSLYQKWGEYPFARALTATGKDTFYYRSEYASIHFERDAKGIVVRTIWQWPGGEPVVFEKVRDVSHQISERKRLIRFNAIQDLMVRPGEARPQGIIAP